MEPRMKNPALLIPDAMTAIQGLAKSVHKADVPPRTLELVHLRASQINGCSYCVDRGVRGAKEAGETDERLGSVAAWREAPYFTDAERAALDLAEGMTRLSDRAEAVSDEVWQAVTKHFDEQARAALILWIATTNLFNRVNTTIKEPAGTTWG